MLSRRGFLAGAAALALVPAVGSGKAPKSGFRFVHMTDLHMKIGCGAREGIALAVRRINALNPRPDFVIVGGDICDGLMGGPSPLVERLYGWVEDELAKLEVPVHHVVGNHDIVGWGRTSDRSTDDPLDGKQRFLDRFVKAPAYRSFRHKGVKFLLLDSIQVNRKPGPTPYVCRVDDEQLQWINDEIHGAGDEPIIAAIHAPLMSSFMLYADETDGAKQRPMMIENSKELHEVLRGHDVPLVLQGHTHVAECVDYAGRRHITSGAVCGEWWNGKRFGVDPEGFSVIDYNPDEKALDKRIAWTYEPTGWKALA